jgi:hypothetical protein
MRYKEILRPVEALAIEIMIDILSDTDVSKKAMISKFEEYVRDEFYEPSPFKLKHKPKRPLQKKEKVVFDVDGLGNVKKPNEKAGNFFEDYNAGDGYFVFPNPYRLKGMNKWKKVKIGDIRKDIEMIFTVDKTKSPINTETYEALDLAVYNAIRVLRPSFEMFDGLAIKIKVIKEKEAAAAPVSTAKGEKDKEKKKGGSFLDGLLVKPSKYDDIMEYEIVKAKYVLFKNYMKTLYKKREVELTKKADDALFMRFAGDEKSMEDEEIPYFLYCDLLRKLLIKYLNIAGIWTRSFVDDEEEEIFVVFKATEVALAQEACSGTFYKEVETGYVDILSLMPVDKQLRPCINKSLFFKELTPEERVLENDDEVSISMDKQSSTNEAFIGYSKRINRLRKVHMRNYIKVTMAQFKNVIVQSLQPLGLFPYDIFGFKYLNDQENTRVEWESYIVYAKMVMHWLKFLSKYKKNPEVDRLYGLIMRLVMDKCIEDSNSVLTRARNTVLLPVIMLTGLSFKYNKTIWDELEMRLTPYIPFRIEEEYLRKFKTYEINEEGMRYIFNSQERIFCCFSSIEKICDISKLTELKMISRYSSIHNRFQMFGEPQKEIFKPIVYPDAIEDFLEPNADEGSKENDLIFLFNKILPKAGKTDFIKSSVTEENSMFALRNLLGINIETTLNYYGSKIALYFHYRSFYLKTLLFVGFIIWILDWARSAAAGAASGIGEAVESNLMIISCYIIAVWSFIFFETWKRDERRYAVKFGQEKYLLADKQRTNFRSRYIRDVANSNPNALEDRKKRRRCIMIISLLISLGIIILSVASVFGILYLKYALQKSGTAQFWQDNIPVIVDIIRIAVFDAIYSIFLRISNRMENHKYRSTYEKSFILKYFSFVFMNNFVSFFIIVFIKGNVNLEFLANCENYENDSKACFRELSTQVQGIFALKTIFSSVLELVIPWATIKFRLRKRFEVRDYEWANVDLKIMTEDKWEGFDENEDIEGTIELMTRVFLQMSYLILFGISYSFGFILAILFNIIGIHVAKIKLCYLTKRPIPKISGSINSWNSIVSVLTFIGPFINSSILVFNANLFDDPDHTSGSYFIVKRLFSFTWLTFSLLTIRKVIEIYFKRPDHTLEKAMERQKFVIEKTFSGLGHGGGKGVKAKAGLLTTLPENLIPLVSNLNLRINQDNQVEEVAAKMLGSASAGGKSVRSYKSRPKSKVNSRGGELSGVQARHEHPDHDVSQVLPMIKEEEEAQVLDK